MTPTNKLRFIERVVCVSPDGLTGKTAKILQQWHKHRNTVDLGFGEIEFTAETGEWRDVPVEVE